MAQNSGKRRKCLSERNNRSSEALVCAMGATDAGALTIPPPEGSLKCKAQAAHGVINNALLYTFF